MIIKDDAPPSPSKSNVPLQSPSVETEPLSPPAYGAAAPRPYEPYNATIGGSSAYSSGPYSPLLAPSTRPHTHHVDLEAHGDRERDSPARRFWKAFAVAFLIYVLAWILFGSFTVHVHSYRARKSWYNEFAIPEDITIISCTRGTEMQNDTYALGSSLDNSFEFESDFPLSTSSQRYGSVHTSLSIPLSSTNTLFLLSRGLASGDMRIASSPSLIDTDSARVNVRMTYVDPRSGDSDVLEKTTVCLVRKKGKAGGKGKKQDIGVGLFSPRQWPNSGYLAPQIIYDMTLVLPQARGPSLVHLDAFETDLPNFRHVFSDSLDEFVTFGRLSLKGGNGRVSAVSLTAENATIYTSNAEIEIQSLKSPIASLYTTNEQIRGHFTTSSSLEIHGSNAKVKALIDLVPRSGDREGKVVVKTTNSFIDAVINVHERPSSGLDFRNSSSPLSSSSWSYSPRISTSTSSGYINVRVPLLPLNSALSLTASTTGQPIKASLPPTYEGSYTLSTTNARVTTEILDEDAEDPAGLGRTRKWGSGADPSQGSKARASDKIYWDEKNKEMGRVNLKSMDADVWLGL